MEFTGDNTLLKSILFFICLFYIEHSFSEDSNKKLIFSIDIILHGESTTMMKIPGLDIKWKEGDGELISNGMQNAFHLGENLRKKYIEKTLLLEKNYDSKSIYVRSTNTNRTIMTAQSILLGLYPLGSGPKLLDANRFALPSGFQPIPIHSIEDKNDFLKNTVSKEMMEKYVYHRNDWIDVNDRFKSNFEKYSKIFHTDIQNISDLAEIGDTLYTLYMYNKDLPKTLTLQEVKDLAFLSDFVYMTSYMPHEIGIITSKNLFQNIIDLINGSHHNLKYVMMVGHKTTILGLMSYLNSPLNSIPEYNSDLNISVFQDINKKKFVEVSLNERIIKLKNCGYSCPVEIFSKLGIDTK